MTTPQIVRANQTWHGNYASIEKDKLYIVSRRWGEYYCIDGWDFNVQRFYKTTNISTRECKELMRNQKNLNTK